jgi:hypothetical protein
VCSFKLFITPYVSTGSVQAVCVVFKETVTGITGRQGRQPQGLAAGMPSMPKVVSQAPRMQGHLCDQVHGTAQVLCGCNLWVQHGRCPAAHQLRRSRRCSWDSDGGLSSTQAGMGQSVPTQGGRVQARSDGARKQCQHSGVWFGHALRVGFQQGHGEGVERCSGASGWHADGERAQQRVSSRLQGNKWAKHPPEGTYPSQVCGPRSDQVWQFACDEMVCNVQRL